MPCEDHWPDKKIPFPGREEAHPNCDVSPVFWHNLPLRNNFPLLKSASGLGEILLHEMKLWRHTTETSQKQVKSCKLYKGKSE